MTSFFCYLGALAWQVERSLSPGKSILLHGGGLCQWAFQAGASGIVGADEMDFRRCLDIQRPYLGPVTGVYPDWTPLENRGVLFPEDLDESDPWQFANVIVR